MTIMTRKTLSAYDVQDMCKKYNYYTNGNCEEYDNLFEMVNQLLNVTDNDIYNIAVDIINHTDKLNIKQNIDSMMFNVGYLVHTFYTITD